MKMDIEVSYGLWTGGVNMIWVVIFVIVIYHLEEVSIIPIQQIYEYSSNKMNFFGIKFVVWNK